MENQEVMKEDVFEAEQKDNALKAIKSNFPTHEIDLEVVNDVKASQTTKSCKLTKDLEDKIAEISAKISSVEPRQIQTIWGEVKKIQETYVVQMEFRRECKKRFTSGNAAKQDEQLDSLNKAQKTLDDWFDKVMVDASEANLIKLAESIEELRNQLQSYFEFMALLVEACGNTDLAQDVMTQCRDCVQLSGNTALLEINRIIGRSFNLKHIVPCYQIKNFMYQEANAILKNFSTTSEPDWNIQLESLRNFSQNVIAPELQKDQIKQTESKSEERMKFHSKCDQRSSTLTYYFYERPHMFLCLFIVGSNTFVEIDMNIVGTPTTTFDFSAMSKE